MKKIEENKNTNHKFLWFVLVAFFVGCAFGYIAHYLVVNWHGFFVVCNDGNRPDKNGCCSGEKYTDVGAGWMVCCPVDGGDCFPPMK